MKITLEVFFSKDERIKTIHLVPLWFFSETSRGGYIWEEKKS
jgi:hypothetical protein